MRTMERARAMLRQYFGYDDFRRGQVDVVASVIEGRDTLGVLPTGGGKSLCYQVPALVFDGMTVVISPLISLMKDQVDRLERLKVPATFLNSTLDSDETARRLASAEQGILRLLYVAPERFEASDLKRCLGRCNVALLAVDEAHCISEWGHEFRPSFRRIADVAASLAIPQTMALTATATPRVRTDITQQLRLRDPRVIVAGFDRTNLSYAVVRCRGDSQKQIELLRTLARHQKPAIVYASTRAAVERTAKIIQRGRVRTLPYHGGLDADRRRTVQDIFMAGDVDCLVATNAFGMGIDKPNVRLVVHYTMSGTLEAYYQEAGRAGRDGQPGHCVLLNEPADRGTHEFFLRSTFPHRRDVEQGYTAMQRASVDGRVNLGASPSAGVLRVLEQCGAVVQRRPDGFRFHVRILATTRRAERELRERAAEREVFQALSAMPESSGVVELRQLFTRMGRHELRSALAALRDGQFIDFDDLSAGIHLTQPTAPLAHFDVPWAALGRRATTEMTKLDAMEGYIHTRACRRWFVLRYFGEHGAATRCNGCDNCENGVRV